jgi:hypothetical protein
MGTELKKCVLTFTVVIALPGLWSCNGAPTSPTTSNAGIINATLKHHVGGRTPAPCTAPAITWTAFSQAGSPQSKTSNAGNSTSQCDELTHTEGGVKAVSCSCPVTMSFTGMAPGVWTIQAGTFAICSAKVNAGQTVVVAMFEDGRSCKTFP